MKKYNIGVSIGAAMLLILATLSSVIGLMVSSDQNQKSQIDSPLFSLQTSRSIHGNGAMLQTNYLGKGSIPSLFPRQSSLQSLLEKAMHQLNTYPKTLDFLLKKISQSPQLMKLLQENHLNIFDVKRYMIQIRDHPDEVFNNIRSMELAAPLVELPSQPLGMNTSSAFGCFITILVLLPIAIVLGLIIATLLIVTCFNIGGCFETILEQILAALIQEIRQPDESQFL